MYTHTHTHAHLRGFSVSQKTTGFVAVTANQKTLVSSEHVAVVLSVASPHIVCS